jgi:hypothetical protein
MVLRAAGQGREMGFLLRLPLLLLQALVRRIAGADRDDARFAPAAGPRASAPPPAAPQTPGGGATFTGVTGAAPGANGAHLDEEAHIEEEEELVESFGPARDVGATITIDEPWDGYAGQPADAIVERLREADLATKGVVALYERAHKNRVTVLSATG